MIIALDYDGTFTESPHLWRTFMEAARGMGHTVYIVTARHESEGPCRGIPDWAQVYYTGREAKGFYMRHRCDIPVDVWIDDDPTHILISHD